MNRYLSTALGGMTLLAAMNGAAVAQSNDFRGYHGHMWGDGYGFGFMGFGMMFLFWALIIFLVVIAVRWFMDRDNASKKSGDALETLKLRLARGEIDVAEYEERRKALEG
ncbi:SHOCT domain-containing protein [Stappia sediminis]|nr:SHOCT domain-containing protein [Stappia sediminis]